MPTIKAKIPRLEDWKAQVKCQTGCPVSTDAGRYVQLIAAGRDEEAYLVARAPNPLASICARVCAAPCEDACRRGRIDAPVTIRALKRTVTERFGAESTRPDTQDRLRAALVSEGNRYPGHLPVLPVLPAQAVDARRRVAVVGAGPAGLAAAHDLALLGYAVTILEASAEPGGMLRFGIPEYRLPRGVIAAEVEKIRALGVELRLSTPLREGYGLAELRREGFEAIFLSVGVQKGRDLALEGAELDGVVRAVDYLLNANRGFRTDLGRRVVVVGGGFVAFDAARTALRVVREGDLDALVPAGGSNPQLETALDSARQALRGGASEVTIVSLESFEEMPVLRSEQGHEELEEAKKEGVGFLTRRGPRRFVGAGGKLRAVELRKVLSVFDEAGRFAPRYDDADVLTLEADGCILAIGQRADVSFLRPEDGVRLTPAGIIEVNRETLATSAPGVYAGGDIAFGPRNIIDAVANGKRAARSIHGQLSREAARTETLLEIEQIPTREYRTIAGFEILDRAAPPTIDVGRRTGVAEVETAFDEAEARAQAARCLVCHVQTIYDPEACVLCGRCVDVCPEYCLALVPLDALELPAEELAAVRAQAGGEGLPLSAMIKDDERCIRCGLCATRCPTGAMTMERFTITERYAAAAAPVRPAALEEVG